MERVAGIQTGGSERAFDLYMKTRYLHQQHPDGRHLRHRHAHQQHHGRDVHVQRYLDPEGLDARSLAHFDAWAATFGEVVDAMELAPDGASLRPRSRFAKFTNLPELQQMFRSYADVQTAAMLTCPARASPATRRRSSPARCQTSSTPSRRPSWRAMRRSARAEQALGG